MGAIKHAPDMNIENQIRNGVKDIGDSLIEYARNPGNRSTEKANYQLNAIVAMILQHEKGQSIPWSERSGMVEEEFS
jgi:hypothetical protein